MRTITIKPLLDYYLWAPLALTGPDLAPEKDILLEIKNSIIVSQRVVLQDCLPASVLNHPRFYALEGGTTLLPALIDAHVHLALDGKDFNRSRVMWDDRVALENRIRQELNEMISSGIGAVRDGGDCRGINLEARHLVESEQCPGPRIVATGQAIRARGGYGSFLGSDYHSRAEIPVMVERIWASGADQLKVVVSGVVSFIEYGLVKGPLMQLDELRYILSCARERGLKVMAHASSAAAVDLAVEADVDSIEHGYFARSESLKLMAEKQMAWIPTIIPVAVQAREPLLDLRTPLELDVINKTYQGQIEKLNLALELGVPVGVGTDSGAGGVSHAHNLIEELMLYKAASLTNRQVLQAATSTNAGILGFNKEIGILDRGYRAALIAVRGNPLEDLEALKDVVVYLNPGP